jgi:acetyl-CoA C-acetyltransferase
MFTEVYIVNAVRTAIGSFGGSLKRVSPSDLGAHVTAEVVKRSGVDSDTIWSNVVGHVIRTEARDVYISRLIALNAGLPVHTQSLTVNRLCGSGIEAIIFAAQQIQLGEVGVAVAGGTECMSSGAHLLSAKRWGMPLGDGKIQDTVIGALTDPFGVGHMGVTGENLSEQYKISREEQDLYALESQRRTKVAIKDGRFIDQIVPYEVTSRRKTKIFDADEYPKFDCTLEGLAKLAPAFKEGGTVTAGNASGINDGAAMALLASEQEVKKQNLQPMARVVAYARHGVPNHIMGIGPVSATNLALKRAGLKVSDMDVIESNEAFAVTSIAVARDLELPDDKTNPNGGSIALGHPIGASGAIIVTKLVHELKRIGGKYGLATMCIGGGQGIALIVEAV